jgi:hypothetical protein
MEQVARSVTWEAPESTHPDHGGDWYFALGIITLGVIVAAILLSNFLFALLAAISGASIAVAASQPPRILEFGVTIRGIKVANTLYPFASLRSYYINEDDPRGPQLLIMGTKVLMPMLVIPIPEEYIDEIEEILTGRIPEEFLEEPLLNRIIDLLGF